MLNSVSEDIVKASLDEFTEKYKKKKDSIKKLEQSLIKNGSDGGGDKEKIDRINRELYLLKAMAAVGVGAMVQITSHRQAVYSDLAKYCKVVNHGLDQYKKAFEKQKGKSS
jgi:hypothetical protein